jgi:hypothetical protein
VPLVIAVMTGPTQEVVAVNIEVWIELLIVVLKIVAAGQFG